MQNAILSMTVSEHVYEYAVRLIRSTRPGAGNAHPMVEKYIQWGAGPRAAHFLVLAAKGRALIQGRPTPTVNDVNEVVYATLNHRIILNFQAEAESIDFKSILGPLVSQNQ
jgi:MoxR-like ATPase